jgi:hypothetical protein
MGIVEEPLSPGVGDPSPSLPAPQAVMWNRVFCVALGLINLLVAWACLQIPRWAVDVPPDVVPPEVFPIVAYTFAGAAVLFSAMAFFLVALPRRPWVWAVHLTNIALGMGLLLTIPLLLPLLLAWLRPAVREYFGLQPPT